MSVHFSIYTYVYIFTYTYRSVYTYVYIERQTTCFLADSSKGLISVNKYELIDCQRNTEMWIFNPDWFGENNIVLYNSEK